MKDLMIDLETWGTKPGCVVVQIGACMFDKETGAIGEKFSYNIDPRDSVKQGFTIEVDTVLWWLGQSKQAQDDVHRSPFLVRDSLESFTKWLQGKTIERAWCHKDFDLPLLAAYYNKTDREFPLKHFIFRDLRTILDLAKMNIKNRPRVGTHHSGLDDCLFQVGYVVDCLKIISKS